MTTASRALLPAALLLCAPLTTIAASDAATPPAVAAFANATGDALEETREPETRPLRSQASDIPELAHHAGTERYRLPLPFGEPQFERFRAAYLSSGGTQWLEAVYERSRPYASYVYERIRYYGAPEELFFLPFIESEYTARAVSRSGASGLWQFMRNSVGGYDMRIDEWLDERRDFMKSTDAALRKLMSNYERFGDWLLAIAAYNCGAGAMDRAIKAGGTRDYWALRDKALLPPETAAYIPKFLAVVSVAMHAGRNGLSLTWSPTVSWVRVPLERPVDVEMLASAAGVPPELMRLGNAELRYGVSPPEGRYEIKVPAEFEARVRAAMASTAQLMNVYVHSVRSGDTVSALSAHYEVPVAMIARMNPGLNPDVIRIGQRIAVPAFKEKKPYIAERPSGDELSFTGRYTVVKGDTLWNISLRYGVQPELLAEKNNLTLESVLREGLALFVPILK
ncbi:MAG: transglycosylase SLT domain-containing protein [Spirochaetales bacterium]|nr:transglycosylase SLT domain-containing protein [Spirochaetales bacterium]